MMLHGIRILALMAIVFLLSCGPGEEALLRSLTAEWRSEEMAGGMRIRLAEDRGMLIGLASNGTVQDSMVVDVTRVDPGARTVHLRRIDTDAPFTLELLEPGEDGRSRIQLGFPNGREVPLVFERPLSSPSEDSGG